MKRYKIREESGASEITEAESLAEALETACEWASEGSYGERVMVRSAGTQRNPGELEETIEYSTADERSLAWVEEQ